jgi:DNA mismatch repair protein MutL
MTIEVLPEEVASAIAAGEVVERPASVVRELMENAIDAQAKRIVMVIEGGGRALIEVADDGLGIARIDLPLAVARFATSKLRTRDDLFAIRSLGFRGEALASIGAVAELTISSRIADEPAGAELAVEGGTQRSVRSIGLPPGTLVRVRNLFFNVPARRAFLKSEQTERRWITSLVSRYALAYPGISFSLTQEGRLAFSTAGDGDCRGVLAAVYGSQLARDLIQLPVDGSLPIGLSGFISPPTVQRTNRRELTFFVNGRWVQDASLAAAAIQAYHGLLMVGRYPMVILQLQLPPDQVDVNVHPAKSEVRFRDQGRIFRLVQRVIRSTLLGHAPAPELELNIGRSWREEGSFDVGPSWLGPHDPIDDASRDMQQIIPLQPPQGGPMAGFPLLRPVGQVGRSYLVAEGPDGIYLIDQHAAHERVLFERLMEQVASGGVDSQGLLEAEMVELSADQAPLLEDQRATLNRLGFDVEPFGRRAFRVRALPALLGGLSAEVALRAAVEDFEEDETPLLAEVEARLAARVCKRGAVKAGQILSLAEQQQLIRDLERCRAPRTCPHGRPTMIHLSVETLERQFGRRG